jgi:chromosomal replication initiation ATPase DnaA
LARAWAEQVGARVLVAGDDEVLVGLDPDQDLPVVVEDADLGAPDDTLFHLINRAGIAGGGLLLTAKTPPSAWSASLPDLRSRLNALSVAELPPPDDIVLEGVLHKFFREQNVKPSDDLIPYLIRRMERSVPYARRLVERLDDLADAERKGVSRALARQLLDSDDETEGQFE